jgi:hypothetical protein
MVSPRGRPYSPKLPPWRAALRLWCLESYLLRQRPPYVPRGQGVSILHAPACQSSFIPYRIILDPVDRLPGEPCGHGDLANASRFSKHRLRILELLAAVARLATLIGPRVPIGFRVGEGGSPNVNAEIAGFLTRKFTCSGNSNFLPLGQVTGSAPADGISSSIKCHRPTRSSRSRSKP